MSILELRSRIGSNSRYTAVEEQGIPAWETQWNNSYSSWWSGGDTYTGFYFSVVNNTAYIQYGKNATGWAGTRFITETVTWTNEQMNNDGSVTCDVTVDLENFRGHVTEYVINPVPVVHTLTLNGTTVMQYSGSTGDTFDVAPIVPRTTARITVAPQQYSDAIELVFHAHYPTGIFPDANIIAGVTLYNPTVPSYIPMATRKDGHWLNLSDNSGHILIRQNGWQDRSLELFASAKQPNQGHNRIRRNNQWLQLPKM